MKRFFALLCALLTLGAAALAAPEAAAPVYGKNLKNGKYKIEVESSSSMFRVVDCDLTVNDGEMTAVMTLSGTGYEKLFMGTGEEAAAASDDQYIYFKENADGKYTYTVPAEALNADIACAAFSTRKQQWYDRTLVFQADSLPKGAVKAAGTVPFSLMAVAVLVIIVSAAALILRK